MAYEAFRQIYSGKAPPWFEKPSGLATRPVCARSGAVPQPFCLVQANDFFIPGISPATPCAVHRQIRSNPDTGLAGGVVEAWSPDVEAFLRGQGMAAAAGNSVPGGRLRIASPTRDARFVLHEAMPRLRQQVRLAGTTDAATNDPLYWFVDRELFAVTRAGQPVFWPLKQGRHSIACSDSRGNTDQVEIHVATLIPARE